jgi:5-hydroxyisourate hydrolase
MEFPERSLVPTGAPRSTTVGAAPSTDRKSGGGGGGGGGGHCGLPLLPLLGAVVVVLLAVLGLGWHRVHDLDGQVSAQAAASASLARDYDALLSARAVESPLSVHVLDTRLGKPGAGVSCTLEVQRQSQSQSQSAGAAKRWETVGTARTAPSGRLERALLPAGAALEAGATYRLTFDTGAYFEAQPLPPPSASAYFYPEVAISFRVDAPTEHYHIPLLISPFGYTTYRGS